MAAATTAMLHTELELADSARLLAHVLPAPIDTDSTELNDTLPAMKTDNIDDDLSNLSSNTSTVDASDVASFESVTAAREQHVSPPARSATRTPNISPPTTSTSSSSSQQHCLSLPFELYRPIIENITSTRDLRTLAVCSRITQPDAERLLHHTVQAYGLRAVAQRCVFLARYPRVARMVRRVVFRERDEHSDSNTTGTSSTTSGTREKSWSSAQPLPAFFRLVAGESVASCFILASSPSPLDLLTDATVALSSSSSSFCSLVNPRTNTDNQPPYGTHQT